jgi:predicted aspartyl protease
MLWVDTGSPNTLVSSSFAARFGLSPVGTRRYNGKVAGIEFRNKFSITIPQIDFPGCLPLKNVRALVALEDNEWNEIIVLGLNVLNHLTYTVSRDSGTFEWLESLTSGVPGSDKSKCNHLIWNGTYLLADDDVKS